jgi:hypothetical protein
MSEELNNIQKELVGIKQIIKKWVKRRPTQTIGPNKRAQKHLEKQEKFIELINREAAEGIIHTTTSFGMKFQYTNGLLNRQTISKYLSDMARYGLIKFFDNPMDYGFKRNSCSTYINNRPIMCICTQKMRLKVGDTFIEVEPTHYKELADGSIQKIDLSSIKYS